MRSVYLRFFLVMLTLGLAVCLLAQGFERNLPELKQAQLITDLGEGQIMVNTSLNHFHIFDEIGRLTGDILHTNNRHPNDSEIGESLIDLSPRPLLNGDIVFLARKRIREELAQSDILYFNYYDEETEQFTIQTTIFLPAVVTGISVTGYNQFASYTFHNGHFYIASIFHATTGERYPTLSKVNLQGQLLWTQAYVLPYGDVARVKTIEPTAGGDLLFGLEYADFEYYNLQVGEAGQEIDGQYLPLFTTITNLDPNYVAYFVQPDGGLMLFGDSPNNQGDTYYSFNAEGQLLWSRIGHIVALKQAEIHQIRATGDGFILTKVAPLNLDQDRPGIIIMKVDFDGELLWWKNYIPDYITNIYDVGVLTSGDLVFGGAATNANPSRPVPPPLLNFAYLLKLGANGNMFDSQFEGQTFEDIDSNCDQLVEAPLGGWLVAFQSSQDTFYALSNDASYYERPIRPDTYTAQLYPPSEYWGVCPPVSDLVINDFDTLTQHFPAQVEVECPKLAIHISAPLVRRCFTATYTVNYCNTGTVLAEDAYITIELDPNLTYSSATTIPTTIQGQSLRFDVGMIDMGMCGDFQITVDVGCGDVLLGQTHCTTATIYPNAPCVVSSDWSGASLQAQALCKGDSVQLIVKNLGRATTTSPIQYRVIEDQVILLEEDNGNPIPPNDSLVLSYPANGATYRIEVQQEPSHPGESFPAASIEACAVDPSVPISLGYVTQYWENDADSHVSIDCQQNIGAYDPNDKRAYPGGIVIDGINYLEANQPILYHIRFQNTGTDTAFKVVVKDIIDTHLDLSSLHLGSASHPYTLEITPWRELVFMFDNINLVDSFRNEPLSHGFVSFTLDQISDLAPGTKITNEAAIFFDFNVPIITNTWQHVIWEEDLPRLEPPTTNPLPLENLRIVPNPVTDVAQVWAPITEEGVEVELYLLASTGELLRTYKQANGNFRFERSGLPNGIYFLELYVNGQLSQRGRVAIQY